MFGKGIRSNKVGITSIVTFGGTNSNMQEIQTRCLKFLVNGRKECYVGVAPARIITRYKSINGRREAWQ